MATTTETFGSDSAPAETDDVRSLLSTLHDAEARLQAVDGRVRRLVMEKPFVALAGALTAGFLVGRLLSR